MRPRAAMSHREGLTMPTDSATRRCVAGLFGSPCSIARIRALRRHKWREGRDGDTDRGLGRDSDTRDATDQLGSTICIARSASLAQKETQHGYHG